MRSKRTGSLGEINDKMKTRVGNSTKIRNFKVMYKWVRDRSVSGIALSFSVERRLGVCLGTNREGNFRGQRRRVITQHSSCMLHNSYMVMINKIKKQQYNRKAKALSFTGIFDLGFKIIRYVK